MKMQLSILTREAKIALSLAKTVMSKKLNQLMPPVGSPLKRNGRLVYSLHILNFSISLAAAAEASTTRARSKFSAIRPPIILFPMVRFAVPPKPLT